MDGKIYDVLVVGSGPAGLSAAISAGLRGARVLLVDANARAGGQLFKQIHKFFGSSAHRSGTRGFDIGRQLLDEARAAGVETWLSSAVIGLFSGNRAAIERFDGGARSLVTVRAKAIIVCTGASENIVTFKGCTMPGVMGAGAAQTMVNVNHVRPGSRVVTVGSGNVGLIVSYQLMQAGCEVVALVEAAPKIGGYAVHAAKIRRAGVPFFMRHTVVEAVAGADGAVARVVIAAVDDKFQPVAGTEREIEADTVAIGAGLKPVTELLRLAGCAFTYNAACGGWIPLHSAKMETTLPDVFVAGDTTGVEEANTALEEGKIAGVSAAESLGLIARADADAERAAIEARLRGLRLGPFGVNRQRAKDEVFAAFAAAKLEGGCWRWRLQTQVF
jgi:NADPH-dependent 2,4-dienoyl-CoA reductase/sulfur reductase-like enzyme